MEVYIPYKAGKTAVAVVSVIQAEAINDYQPANGMNSPVAIDNTAVAKNRPLEISPTKATVGLCFLLEGNMKMKSEPNKMKEEIKQKK